MINVNVGGQSKSEVKPFPKLMRYKNGGNMVVLFTSSGRGHIIVPDESGTPSYDAKCEGWRMENFEDFNEPVTLQNA